MNSTTRAGDQKLQSFTQEITFLWYSQLFIYYKKNEKSMAALKLEKIISFLFSFIDHAFVTWIFSFIIT